MSRKELVGWLFACAMAGCFTCCVAGCRQNPVSKSNQAIERDGLITLHRAAGACVLLYATYHSAAMVVVPCPPAEVP